ncbi:MAG: HAD family hydrolase [Anaerolineae bacterium]|nr:HAD family hydrolase [Anaerolineae bacterium]
MIRAVVFDLGGTLLDFHVDGLAWLEWERVGLLHAHAAFTAQGYALPEEAFVSYVRDSLEERWQCATEGGENLRLGDMLRGACAACGASPTDAQIDEAVAHYIAPLDAGVAIYPDALDTLRELRARGLRIGLVSNTMWPGAYHRHELDRFGLSPYLDHAVFSSDVGVWKPQAGIYQLSLDALGICAGDAVFVGDSPEHDIVGAQGVGMRAVYKRNRAFVSDAVEPDAEVHALAELPDLIDRW